MFGKLVKYEFKSLGKWYLALYGILTILSVVLGSWIQTIIRRSENHITTFNDNNWNMEGTMFVLAWVAFGLLVGGLLISTFFLVVARFQKSVYGRQGYLTMTLPVTGHQIILSKLLASIIWYILAGLMLVISGFIITSIALVPIFHEIEWHIAFSELTNITYWPTIFQILFYYFTEMILGILLAYFAISLGQLFKDHRTLLAIGFYLGIQFVIGTGEMIYFVTSTAMATTQNSETFLNPFLPTPLFIIFNIILAIGFYFGTHYIMTKRLNIQ
ncbi:hypothetical protein K6V78_07965 [Streptococcus gallolyticus]|uniref:hypothetical protein n=1 Tax=Streptococcus hepaticus TaxID=3349163 RepID=UPI001C958A54|nr:hypothetical protein [Streptococcus gallolyticus]MBY5041244.1 hypothetical protein [Streptococcus gallolyticus]